MENRNERGHFLPGHTVSAYTEEQMDQLIDSYCVHLANAFDKDLFEGCDYRTIENSKNLTILQTEKIRKAKAKGRLFYETMLRTSITGLDMTVNEGRENAQTIKAKAINPISLIFAMKSKYRETYGDKVDGTMKTDLNLTGSVPCEIIDPDTKQLTRLSIGIPPESQRVPDTVDPDAEDYERAMREINK